MDRAACALGTTRKRATKACNRCKTRKIKCDVASQPSGTACSRCRMDRAEHECMTGISRRGTYERKPSGRMSLTYSKRSQAGIEISRASASAAGLRPAQVAEKVTNRSTSDLQHFPRSRSSMFEEFLDQNGYGRDDTAAAQLGIILFGESSPLTFALKESTSTDASNFYDAATDLLRSNRGGQDMHASQHPPHSSAEEIAYLGAKGAFTLPEDQLREQLLIAFLEHFHPLYTIFNKGELLHMNETRGLKWIVLHAICFIGATFCEASVLHRFRFKSRLHARRLFYERAKVLFDTGYETDKISLLQTTLMMSFWGPQMKSYWNPCSWIGFAATIAESLGIYRSTSSARANGKDKSLFRRLWWALVVRDAYCATLLGRPFRINIQQCDTEMLDANDFSEDVSPPAECPDYALYQIHVARLSVIVRKIQQGRCGTVSRDKLYRDLTQWWESTPACTNEVFVTSLLILYHYHRILIYLNDARTPNAFTANGTAVEDAGLSSAQTIAATASQLVTKQVTTHISHEIFIGYFLAAIVLYRQVQNNDGILSQFARSSLDNCQMLLNEVRELWDPARWVIRIFEFLLSSASESGSRQRAANENTTPVPTEPIPTNSEQVNDASQFSIYTDELFPADWTSSLDGWSFGDFFCMPPFVDPSCHHAID